MPLNAGRRGAFPAQYISVSRRCDMPRFRSGEFLSAWERGEITYDGGFGRSYTVSLKPEHVLGYVFWSKDYRPLIDDPRFGKLIAGNNAVFHYTINDCPDLESGVAPLGERLATLRRLCAVVGPERVLWRYDPICRYRAEECVRDTVRQFFPLLSAVRAEGVSRCYFSFMTWYGKLKGRGVDFEGFSSDEKKDIAAGMLEAAGRVGVTLHNCCNEEVPALVPGVARAHCVDEELLRTTDRFGVHRTLKPRPTRKGCGCFESRDVGSYTPSCRHGCLYCYANPRLTTGEP